MALARGLRSARCWGVFLAGLASAQQGLCQCAAVVAAPATAWGQHPHTASGAALATPGWHRTYSTPPVEAWESLRQSFSTIDVNVASNGVAVLTIDRPQALNALNSKVMSEIVSACLYLDRNHATAKVIIITGSGDKAFAAGADIKELASVSYADAYHGSMLNGWETLRSVRKPLIAAVNGYALGGGCELAMMCDIILASERAQFGQPEITLGVIPGMGGTQRLPRAVGRSRAMELILTGDFIKAEEAVRIGLASRAVPHDQLMEEAHKVAAKIATHSVPAVAKAKECVAVSQEVSLGEGLRFEKREFWSCFALEDQKEGMAAFVQKRPPVWSHK